MTRDLNLPGTTATEDQFHIAVAELLETVLRLPTFYTTFPAGYGKLSRATSGRLKKKGMQAGMPDILVFHPLGHRSSRVIGLELKVGRNTATAVQRSTQAFLRGTGVVTYLIRTLQDVLDALRDGEIPYREGITIYDRDSAPQELRS